MGGSSSDKAAKQARADELAREERVKKGTAALRYQFGQQFTEPYFAGNYNPATNTGDRYSGLAGAGRKFYDTGINDQYEASRRALAAALSRAGNDKSRTAKLMEKKVDLERGQAMQDMEAGVQGMVNSRRQAVANAEQTAVGQLQASADPAAAAAQAANLINIQSQPEGWSPLGQVFTDATAGLATQADLERSGQNRYNLGVSTWGNRTRRAVRNVSD